MSSKSNKRDAEDLAVGDNDATDAVGGDNKVQGPPSKRRSLGRLRSKSSKSDKRDAEDLVRGDNAGVDTKDDDDSVDESAIKRRCRWHDLEATEGLTKKFPFLTPSNYQDDALVQLLLVHQPFRAGYGLGAASWKKMKSDLMKAKIPGSKDERVFPKNYSVKVDKIKQRMKEIMNWLKKRKGIVPLKVGMYGPETPSRMREGLKTLYDLYFAPKIKSAKEQGSDDEEEEEKPSPLSEAISDFCDNIDKKINTFALLNANELRSEKFEVQVGLMKQEPGSLAFDLYVNRIKEIDDQIRILRS